jgi:hypothetical protein
VRGGAAPSIPTTLHIALRHTLAPTRKSAPCGPSSQTCCAVPSRAICACPPYRKTSRCGLPRRTSVPLATCCGFDLCHKYILYCIVLYCILCHKYILCCIVYPDDGTNRHEHNPDDAHTDRHTRTQSRRRDNTGVTQTRGAGVVIRRSRFTVQSLHSPARHHTVTSIFCILYLYRRGATPVAHCDLLKNLKHPHTRCAL